MTSRGQGPYSVFFAGRGQHLKLRHCLSGAAKRRRRKLLICQLPVNLNHTEVILFGEAREGVGPPPRSSGVDGPRWCCPADRDSASDSVTRWTSRSLPGCQPTDVQDSAAVPACCTWTGRTGTCRQSLPATLTASGKTRYNIYRNTVQLKLKTRRQN